MLQVRALLWFVVDVLIGFIIVGLLATQTGL